MIPVQDLIIAACALRADAAVHSYDHHFYGPRIDCGERSAMVLLRLTQHPDSAKVILLRDRP